MAMYPPINDPTATLSQKQYASSSSGVSLGTHSLRLCGSDPARPTDVSSTDVPTGTQSMTSWLPAPQNSSRTWWVAHHNPSSHEHVRNHCQPRRNDDKQQDTKQTQQDHAPNNRSHTRTTWSSPTRVGTQPTHKQRTQTNTTVRNLTSSKSTRHS